MIIFGSIKHCTCRVPLESSSSRTTGDSGEPDRDSDFPSSSEALTPSRRFFVTIVGDALAVRHHPGNSCRRRIKFL